jgi:hypothetical protein
MKPTHGLAAALLTTLAATAACSSAPPTSVASSSGERTAATSEALTTVYGTALCSGSTACITGPASCTGTVPNVTYNQGSWGEFVMTSPSIYLVHWGAYWTTQPGAAQAAADVAAWKAIGTDKRFWAPLAEYSPPGGPTIAPATDSSGHILFGAVTDPNAASSVLGGQMPGTTVQIPSQLFIQTLTTELTTGILPSPTTRPDTIWVVILPPGVSAEGTTDAFHDTINIATKNYPYAVIPGSGAIAGESYQEGQNPFFPTAKLRGQDIMISHEVYEAVTDSAYQGWYEPVCNGLEVGDLCEGLVTDPIDGYTLSTFWSDANKGCIGPANLNTSTPTTPACGCSVNKDTLDEACSDALCCPKGTGDCGGYCCRCVGTTCY